MDEKRNKNKVIVGKCEIKFHEDEEGLDGGY
jgi:hypothetical protein